MPHTAANTPSFAPTTAPGHLPPNALPTMTRAAELGAARWADDSFLNMLRQLGDPDADACARDLAGIDDSAALTRQIFAGMTQNDILLPASAPDSLQRFWGKTFGWCPKCRQPALPTWVDRDRVRRGQQAFVDRTIPSVLVLLCKSLPEGYAAEGATKVLNISGELLTHTYHRLMGTLQLLIDVSSPGSFERAGMAIQRGQQMRLLHAGVRTNVAPKVLERRGGYQAYVDRYGVPVNQEDMLATIMAFSLLVVRGWDMLEMNVSAQEKEDFYYVWRVFANLMGLHPQGAENSDVHIPETLADAAVFYESYCRRHYAGATSWAGDWEARSTADNPDGVAITQRHVQMLGSLVPTKWQLFSLEAVARIYIQQFIGEAGCARVGIARLRGHWLERGLFLHLPRVWSHLWRRVGASQHAAISKWFLESLVKSSYERGVVFLVPSTLADLQALVDRGATVRGSMAVQTT